MDEADIDINEIIEAVNFMLENKENIDWRFKDYHHISDKKSRVQLK